MKFLNALILSFIGFAGAAQTSAVAAESALICTRDINTWGHASRCNCKAPTKYDQQAGACVKTVFVEGEISAVSSIGGESTGVMIRTWDEPAREYELIIKADLLGEKTVRDLEGKPFEVEGDFTILHGVETGDRPAIAVKSLNVVE